MPRGRPFEKGKSGNPGGRPAGLAAFREKAQKVADIALKVLVEALKDDDVRNRVAAAKEILDRAWGKPTQEITGMNQDAQQITVIVPNYDKPNE